ncbi:MAG: hypothetical protein DIU77_001175, partial [Thermocrispum agreste]
MDELLVGVVEGFGGFAFRVVGPELLVVEKFESGEFFLGFGEGFGGFGFGAGSVDEAGGQGPIGVGGVPDVDGVVDGEGGVGGAFGADGVLVVDDDAPVEVVAGDRG